MKNKAVSLTGLFVVFIVAAVLISSLGSRARVDLTEDGLYTLSPGTRNILSSLEHPVTLDLYFSQQASQDLTALRAYEQRVEELLAEYEMLSDGRLRVNVIDPQPFSEEEDMAAARGLQAVPLNNGDSLYFGLVASADIPVATAAADADAADPATVDPQAGDEDQAEQSPAGQREHSATREKFDILPFLQPDRERFLEYEISQLIDNVQSVKPVVIGVLSGLDVMGGFDPRSGQPTPPWMALDQLDGAYQLRSLNTSVDHIDEDVDVLMLIQPPVLADATLFAIDQFALRGGRVLAFIDPLAENAPAGMMGGGDPASATSLNTLLHQWGVDWHPDQVVLDAQLGLVVNQGQGRPPVRHFGLLSLTPDQLLADDIVTARLENINLSSTGYFAAREDATTTIDPWLFSSTDAMLTDANRLRMGGDLLELQKDFQPTGEAYPLAVRISGPASTAFPDGVGSAEAGQLLTSTDHLAVTLVADTDVLSDRLWVQVQNFFGQRLASPWADNGALLVNLADNLSGSADLISLRARGQYSRPFEKVDELQRQAEKQFLASEQKLQQQLDQVEQQMADLQQGREEDTGVLTLSPQQQAALDDFQQEKLTIRKELRNVQHELDKDINALGTRLKILNIFVFPVVFTLLLGLLAWGLRRRQQL